ncbi:MAG: nucleic acid-binding protein [Acidimicrobiia bacterium]
MALGDRRGDPRERAPVSAEVLRGEEWARSIPRADNVSGPFWQACAEGRLLIQRCPACSHRQFYPRALCTSCGATPEWEEASGRGTVHTFTVIRQNHARPFRDLIPYVVAMVELEEGPMMMGNVTGCPVDDVRIGMPVEVYMVEVEEGLAVPFWRPRNAGA